MKNRTLFLIVFSLLISFNGKSQIFPIDTAKLNSSYRELISKPNTIERQKVFFDAFPNTWTQFIMTYQYLSSKNYDLTMCDLANKQIEALDGRVTLIKDSLYCAKIVAIAIGATLDADAPNYYKKLLHRVMWKRMNGMMNAISRLRKGHQMQFWQFYWSNPVKSQKIEKEYKRMLKLNLNTYPKQIKIMEIAFTYFYDGVNIDGGYLKE